MSSGPANPGKAWVPPSKPTTEHPLIPLVGGTEPSTKPDAPAPQDVQQSVDQLPTLVNSPPPELPPREEPEDLAKPRRDIWLERLVLDIYEYRGLHELGIFVLFFLISSFFLYSQWGTTAASFKNTMVKSFTSYDYGNDWESNTLEGVSSMTDAYQYMTGYLANAVARTENLDISTRDKDVVFVGENAAIRYARIVAKFDDTCTYRPRRNAYEKNNQSTTTACWQDALQVPPYGLDLGPFLTPATSGWMKLEACSKSYCYPGFSKASKDKKKGWFGTQVLVPNYPRSDALQRLATENASYVGGLQQYGKVVAKYAVALQLGILAEDRHGMDAAVFTLTIRLRGPSKRLTKRVGTWSVNNPDHLTPHLQTSFKVYQLLFFLMTLFYIQQELRKWRLCWLQHRSMSFYFRYWWNWTQIVSHVLNVIWICWCWSLKATEQKALPTNMVQYAVLERDADSYTLYLYFGIIVNLLLGVCMCRYMRVHMGLRAFYQVFVDAGRSLLDFAVFVLYIILVLGSATFAFFQISGGNELFITYSNGLSAMARLPFQFLAYEEFHNQGLGMGDWSWTVTGLFWLTVVFLILFTQNTLLAIFNLAYMNARKKSLKVEMSFVSLVVNRILFMFVYYGIRIVQLGSSFKKARRKAEAIVVNKGGKAGSDDDDEVGSPSGAVEERVDEDGEVEVLEEVREAFLVRWWRLWRDERYFMHEAIISKFDPATDPIRNHPRQLLYCRWCIVCMTEMQALAALYTDFATLKLQDTRNEDDRPTWISLGGHLRRVVNRTLGFNAASTLRRAPMTATSVILDGETQRSEYKDYAQVVPAWSSHISERQLARLLDLLTRKRHQVRSTRWLANLLFWKSPFDSLSVLEMAPPDDDAANHHDAEAGPGFKDVRASPEERLPNGKVVDDVLLQTIASGVMQVYVNTSKPIRDVDGDGIDDEEDDPAELLRRFRKLYGKDRITDKAELKAMQSEITEHLEAWKADMHQLMDTLLRHPELRLRR